MSDKNEGEKEKTIEEIKAQLDAIKTTTVATLENSQKEAGQLAVELYNINNNIEKAETEIATGVERRSLIKDRLKELSVAINVAEQLLGKAE